MPLFNSTICLACGHSFDISSLDLPQLQPLPTDRYCSDCLKPLVKAQIDAFCAAVTPETALSCGAQRYARKGPLIEDLDYYLDPDGKFVLTSWYLLKRGHCCQNGCRHCPYGFRR